MNSHHFICGGTAAVPLAREILLELHGPAQNVNLRISDITRSMLADLPDLLLDLLEVAAYVYCADQQASRGTEQLTDYGANWRRQMHFTIPVRQPHVWQNPELRQTLADTLEFLSDDYFDFTFVDAVAPLAPKELYFQVAGESAWVPDRVVLFSGGLDSLAGVISDVSAGERLALVGHHSASKVFALQKQLVEDLGNRGLAAQLFYVPVNVSTKGDEPVEFTQRTRSFLFASLALVAATLFGKDGFTFYENGVISLNLPIAGDVLGARATRTTHPRVIRGFEEFFSVLLGKAISIRTPFQWHTKAEVIATISHHGYGALIAKTSSCTKPRVWTATKHHCGSCSQCVDRRFGVLAAGHANLDPKSDYLTDVFTGAQTRQIDARMGMAYVQSLRTLHRTRPGAFIAEYPEIAGAISCFAGLTADEALARSIDLHSRHATQGLQVMKTVLEENSETLAAGEVASGSLLWACASTAMFEPDAAEDVGGQMREFMDRLQPQRCEFALDETESAIVFRGGYRLEGADYKLVRQLLTEHQTAKRKGKKVAFTPAAALASRLNKEEPALRRQISRLRHEVAGRLAVDQGIVIGPNDFIENSEREGYRLAPALSEVTLFDIQTGAMSQGPGEKVTSDAA